MFSSLLSCFLPRDRAHLAARDQAFYEVPAAAAASGQATKRATGAALAPLQAEAAGGPAGRADAAWTQVDRLGLVTPSTVGDDWRFKLLRPQGAGQAGDGPVMVTNHIANGGYGKLHVGLDGAGNPLAIKQLRLAERRGLDRRRAQARAAGSQDAARPTTGYTQLVAAHKEAAILALPATAMPLHRLFITDDHRAFVATELAAGSVFDFIKGSASCYLPQRSRQPKRAQAAAQAVLVGVALRVMEQAAGQLGDLQEAGYAHNDLKPENLLLSRSQPVAVKLWDFGMAVQKPAQGPFPPYAGGTLRYLSPERLAGHPYDFSSDVFALGCTLVETLTGREAFYVEAARRGFSEADGAVLARVHRSFAGWHARQFGGPAAALPGHHGAQGAFVGTYASLRDTCPVLAAYIYGALMHPDPRRRPSYESIAAQALRLRQQLSRKLDVDGAADGALRSALAQGNRRLDAAVAALRGAQAIVLSPNHRDIRPACFRLGRGQPLGRFEFSPPTALDLAS